MRVSIKIKLASIFIVLYIFASGTTAFILNYLLNDAIIDDKANTIKDNANSFADYVADIDANTASEKLAFLAYYLNIYRQNVGAIIMISDTDGNIILSTPTIDNIPLVKERLIFVEDNIYKFPLSEQYEQIPATEEIRQEMGYFYGLLSNVSVNNVPWLIIRKRLIAEGNNIGTLYIFTPTPEILKIKKSFYNVFIIASAISLILSAILIYLYSKWFIKPINNLKHASSEVAKGNYNEKIQSNSNDEIGELAVNFNDMTRNLARLETARKDFIANTSHELRSPMTSIKGFIDAIIDGIVPEEKVAEYLQLIKSEINRLNNMVTSMLDVAKFDSDELILKKSVFDINSLLRATIAKFEPSIIAKNLKVHANYQEKVLLVEADEEMIERVCLNLIQNSIKYTSTNGDIYIETQKRRNKVNVSIIDNGQGIKLDEINLIWDRFYKTDTSRGVDKVGVGIGLSIVKKILDAHEESITVSSEPNVRTKFTFSLNAKV
jgi:signal transduction histidine kinase